MSNVTQQTGVEKEKIKQQFLKEYKDEYKKSIDGIIFPCETFSETAGEDYLEPILLSKRCHKNTDLSMRFVKDCAETFNSNYNIYLYDEKGNLFLPNQNKFKLALLEAAIILYHVNSIVPHGTSNNDQRTAECTKISNIRRTSGEAEFNKFIDQVAVKIDASQGSDTSNYFQNYIKTLRAKVKDTPDITESKPISDAAKTPPTPTTPLNSNDDDLILEDEESDLEPDATEQDSIIILNELPPEKKLEEEILNKPCCVVTLGEDGNVKPGAAIYQTKYLLIS